MTSDCNVTGPADWRTRLQRLEFRHGDLRPLVAADHQAAMAAFGLGNPERVVQRLEVLLSGSDTARQCECGPMP